MRIRGLVCLAAFAVAFGAARPAAAQIAGTGAIQGNVLDASGGALGGATVTATNIATGVSTVRQTTAAGVYAVSPLPPGEYRVAVSLAGFRTRRAGARHRGRPRGGGSQRRARSGCGDTGGHRVGGAAAARHGRWPTGSDRPQRGLYGAAARDEHRRPARPDAVHVPDAGRAVGRPLGQRDGRAGLHQRSVRGGPADHQLRGPGRGPQSLVWHLGRGRGPVPGGDQRHRGDVQRSRGLELRGQIRDESVPVHGLRVHAQHRARYEVVLRRDQARGRPARVRGHGRRTDSPQPRVLLHGVRRLSRSPADRFAPDLGADRGDAQRRLQRAAGRHLRPAHDTTESERHRLRPRSVPGQRHSRPSDLDGVPGTSSRSCRSRRVPGSRTTIWAGRCRPASTTTTSRPRSI